MPYKDPFQQHFGPISFSSPQITYSVQVTLALLFLEHILFHIKVLVLLIIPQLEHSRLPGTHDKFPHLIQAFDQPFPFE